MANSGKKKDERGVDRRGKRPFINVNKKQLCRRVRHDKKNTLNIPELHTIIDLMIENISDAIVEGEEVYLKGFGRFYPIRRAQMHKNWVYNTYERKAMPAQTVVYNRRVFTGSKTLLERLNGKSEHDTYETYFGDPLFTDDD